MEEFKIISKNGKIYQGKCFKLWFFRIEYITYNKKFDLKIMLNFNNWN